MTLQAASFFLTAAGLQLVPHTHLLRLKSDSTLPVTAVQLLLP